MENKKLNVDNRILYLDVLRIVASFAVMLGHASAQNWYRSNIDSFEWQVFNFYGSMLRWSVPVFAMISGVLFLEGRRNIKKHILRIVTAFAMFVSSVVNSVVNVSVARLLRHRRDGYGTFAVRSFTSTAIAQFVDNLVFALIVSIPLFGWNMTQALTCSITAALFELLLEVCFSGVGYRMTKKWTRSNEGRF